MKVLMKETCRAVALVCCSNGMCEGGSNNKLVDMGHPLGDMGFYNTLVLIYFDI